jgi:hypothetical protein
MTPAKIPGVARISAATVPAPERSLHLFALSRAVPLTPFHNMASICPEQSEADVNRHPAVYEAALTRPAEANIG